MLRTWTSKVALVAGILVAALVAPAAPARAADTLFTAGFEEYPVNTAITDQYPFVTFDAFHVTGYGFTFGSSPGDGVVVGASNNPYVIASGAHSGSHAAQVPCASEFCSAGTFGVLDYTADSLSVYAGENTGVPLELDAYDAQLDWIGHDTATSAGSSAGTQLSVTAPAGKTIAYFSVYHVGPGVGNYLLIDDLTIGVPAGQAPQVGVSAGASSYELGQGGTITIPLTVQRRNGATGAVTVTATGFTADLTGSVTQPGTGNSATLTVHASAIADLTNHPLTLSAATAGADSAPAVVVGVEVIQPLSFASPKTIDAQVCTPHTVTVTAQIAPGEPGPTVSFSALAVPTTGSVATATATSPGTISGGQASTQVTVTNLGAGPDAAVQVSATLTNGGNSQVLIPLNRIGPTITSVSAKPYGAKVVTPQAQHAGTQLVVAGHGFCDQATVQVGNALATDGGTVQHVGSGAGAYDMITVRTPRLATSGPVRVQAGSPPVTSAPSATSLSVDSYRNSKAWKFQNFDPALTYDDLTQAFGVDQTYLSIDPCAAASLGFAHCPIPIVPDPVAYAIFSAAFTNLSKGTCFGLSLSSQRLLEGLDSLPGKSSTVFDRPAPDTQPKVQLQHGKQPLLDLLKADHLMQLSQQFLLQWGPESLALLVGGGGSAATDLLAMQVHQILAAGRFPLISMQDSGGHVVVGYDLVQTGAHAYDVYVYDSNDPFGGHGENSNADAHKSRLESSVIHLTADGHWSLASTPKSGGPGTLVVTDPAIIPKHPALPSAGGFVGLLFGSTGATGSAARISQVSSAGKTLYTPSGALNSNPSTRLAAAPMAALVGSGSAATPMIDVSGQVRQLQVATTGTGSGTAALSFAQGPYVAQLRARTAHGQVQTGSFDSGQGTVGYTGSSNRKVSLSVARDTGASARTVAVTLGAAGQQDQLGLDAHGAVTLSHQGPRTTFVVSLSGGSTHGMPQTFTSQPVSIGPGQIATVSHLSWGTLGRRLLMSVSGHRVVLHDHAKKPRHGTISAITVSAKNRHLRVRVGARFPKLPKTTVNTLVLMVHAGHKLLATYRGGLPVRRHVSRTWSLKLSRHRQRRHRRLTFTAILATSAPRGLTAALGTASRSAGYQVP